MDIHPVTKELYFLGRGDSIFTIDKHNGNATFKVKLNDPQATNIISPTISFNSSGVLYAFDEEGGFSEGKLREVSDLNTGACQAVSSNTSGLPSILGIEFDHTNTLWASDECCLNKMHQISVTTGQSISNSSQALNIGFPCELDFSNNTMYGLGIGDETSSTTTTFYRVIMTTGATETLFSLNDIYFGMAGYKMPKFHNTITVYDTTFVTIIDTNYVSVTDTLIIDNLGNTIDIRKIILK